jgi:hypothetical protein
LKRTLFALFVLMLPAMAADPALAGVWKVEGDVSGTPVNRTCTFEQEGNKLTGKCALEGAPAADLTGEVDGDKVSFKYNVEYNGDTLTLVYTGKITSPTEFKGTFDVQPMAASGDFTAKKEQ